MPTYRVRVFRTLEQETHVTLETNNEEEAKRIAERIAMEEEAYLEWIWTDSSFDRRETEVGTINE